MGMRSSGIRAIMRSTRNYNKREDKAYHDAHLLLNIYSDALWGIENKYAILAKECSETYGDPSLEVLEMMTDFGSETKARLLYEQLEDTEASKVIIDIIQAAMERLKTYPNNGKLYHEILETSYFSDLRNHENQILEDLNIARATYYRQRKKAIEIFGVVLWGYVLPEFIRHIQEPVH